MVSIACPERYVVGIDISEIALERAIQVRTLLGLKFVRHASDWALHPCFLLGVDYVFFCM